MAPGIVIVSAVTADQRLAAGRLAERFYALLLGIVAAAGLGLAALGAYGMLEWSIGRRRREFGIRAALGATPRDIAVSVARQLAWPFALGSLTGLLAARWGTQLLASLLFEVQPGSAGVWTAAGLMLSLMLLGAAAVPARRAGAVSPANALRTE